MIRFLIRVGVALLGAAIGLIVAAAVLEDMTLDGAAFVIAIVIFAVLTAVLEPLIVGLKERGFCFQTLREHPAYQGWIAAHGG